MGKCIEVMGKRRMCEPIGWATRLRKSGRK